MQVAKLGFVWLTCTWQANVLSAALYKHLAMSGAEARWDLHGVWMTGGGSRSVLSCSHLNVASLLCDTT